MVSRTSRTHKRVRPSVIRAGDAVSRVHASSRRTLGQYGVLTIEEARDIAREHLKLIRKGVDPKSELEKERAANLRVRKFSDVLHEYLTRHVGKLSSGKATMQLFDREIPKAWLNRPIGDIHREDCAAVIRGVVKRGHGAQAHVMHSALRRLFSWAIGTGEFGLEISPMMALKPTDLIGERNIRDRVLNDQELKAIWSATDQIGWPVGPIVKLLILTGQRLNDIAQLNWNEVDLNDGLIAIPAQRMNPSVPTLSRSHRWRLTY
jgi:integrase